MELRQQTDDYDHQLRAAREDLSEAIKRGKTDFESQDLVLDLWCCIIIVVRFSFLICIADCGMRGLGDKLEESRNTALLVTRRLRLSFGDKVPAITMWICDTIFLVNNFNQ